MAARSRAKVMSNQAKANQTKVLLTNQAKANQAKANQVKANQVKANQVKKPANPFAAGKPTTMLPPKTPGVMTGATGKPTPFITGPAKAPSGAVSRLMASMQAKQAPMQTKKVPMQTKKVPLQAKIAPKAPLQAKRGR